MARQGVDIGTEGNDGTGDSIRESFKKVNENFQELYAIFGQGGNISFQDLSDTPDNLSGFSNHIPVVNNLENSLEYLELTGNDFSFSYDYTNNTLSIVQESVNIVKDNAPRLGGPLNGGGFAIANVAVDDDAVDLFNSRHNTSIVLDDLVINKKFADQTYQAKTSALGAGIRISDEPNDTSSYIKTATIIQDNNIQILAHGYSTEYSGTLVTFTSSSTAPSGLISGNNYYMGIIDENYVALYNSAIDAIYNVNKIQISGGVGTFTLTDAGYDDSLEGNWLSNVALPRNSVVRRQGDTLEGYLTLHENPVNNFHAATKQYVDTQLVNSRITIGSDLVSLGGTITDLNGLTSIDVDNITINGNTINSTNTNGNIILDPNGVGTVDVSTSKIINVVDPTLNQDAATKKYVDDQLSTATGGVVSNTNLDINDSNGNFDSINLSSQSLTFAEDTGLSVVVSPNNTVTFTLEDTVVTPGSYGNASTVSTFTVDQQGRLTTAGSTSISIPNTQISNWTEAVRNTVSAMVTGNTENGISVEYRDEDGTLDFDVADFTITLTGDVTGSGTVTNLGNVSFVTAITANSVTLGTDTTGDYVESLTAGALINLQNNTGSSATPTIDVDLAELADMTEPAVDTDELVILDAGIQHRKAINEIQIGLFDTADQIALGTDTTGNYVESLVEGTGVTITNNSQESAAPTIAIGQDVSTSSNVTFQQGIFNGLLQVNDDIEVGGDILPDTDLLRNVGSETLPFDNMYANLFNGTATALQGADLAENYLGDANYEPGTVLVFGGEYEVTVTNQKTDHRVAGVVTTSPAQLMNSHLNGDYVVGIALQGRVPCKVLGTVSKGDILVTGAIPGYAIVDNNAQAGRIIGKSLENKTDTARGVVEVVVGKH